MSQGDEAQVGLKQTQNQQDDEKMPIQPFNFYLKPENAFVIINKKWGTFTLFAAVIYLYHLFWTVMGVDKYADNTRVLQCGDQPLKGSTEDERKDYQSAIFDSAILLCTVFHMIEWLRWLSYLTMALVSVNLTKLYYALSLNILFGLFTSCYALATVLSSEGSKCHSSGQPERGRYLFWQVIVLALHIPLSLAHFAFFKFRGVQWCHDVYVMEEDDEDD